MGKRLSSNRRALTALPLGLACAVLALDSCRDPTEITVIVTTDDMVACKDVKGTAITVGAPGSVETSPPNTVTNDCTDMPGGGVRVGTIVLVPESDRNGEVEVRVVMGIDGDATTCTPDNGYKDCIVERRQIHYIPETPLTLPILMPRNCVGVPCTPDTTCYGTPPRCVPDNVDPGQCTDPGGSMSCAPSADGGFTPDAPGADVSMMDSPGDGNGMDG